ncbi:MAG: zinc-ribbon domain-containing protein [Thermodesulfobacteriota bacterium]|nr:zinc-ribbon domain-containing protein [Thermodesulfobacteriota bacterium]
MEITCTSCQAKFNIPDNKIPKDRKASFLCPKCKKKIHLNADPKAAEHPLPEKDTYDASDKPFDFVDKNDQTALVCMGSSEGKQKAETILGKMNFYCRAPKNLADALTVLKYHLFDLIIIDQGFDFPALGSKSLLSFLEKMNMAQRRTVFLVLISPSHRTMDKMSAFHSSVNLIVNETDIVNLKKILKAGMDAHKLFYAIFNESLKKTGKI